MMNNKDKLIIAAAAAFLTLTATHAAGASASDSAKPNTEKCYGVVKTGMNDCATSTASCAGSATKDKQGDAFIFVPTGLCEKLSGGSLTVKTDSNS